VTCGYPWYPVIFASRLPSRRVIRPPFHPFFIPFPCLVSAWIPCVYVFYLLEVVNKCLKQLLKSDRIAQERWDKQLRYTLHMVLQTLRLSDRRAIYRHENLSFQRTQPKIVVNHDTWAAGAQNAFKNWLYDEFKLEDVTYTLVLRPVARNCVRVAVKKAAKLHPTNHWGSQTQDPGSVSGLGARAPKTNQHVRSDVPMNYPLVIYIVDLTWFTH